MKKDATGRNTGIGFCEFRDKQTAEAARKLNMKKYIKGRPLRIDNPDGGSKGIKAVVSIIELFHNRLRKHISRISLERMHIHY